MGSHGINEMGIPWVPGIHWIPWDPIGIPGIPWDPTAALPEHSTAAAAVWDPLLLGIMMGSHGII